LVVGGWRSGDVFCAGDYEAVEQDRRALMTNGIWKELAERRRKNGKTQADVAKEIGITPPNICYLERGNGSVSLGKLKKTAEAYGGDDGLALNILKGTHPEIWATIVSLKKEIMCELAEA